MINKDAVIEFADSLKSDESIRGVDVVKQTFYMTHPENRSVVLMIHGFTSSPQETKFIANLCHQEAHVDVLAICLPGHGSKPEHMKDCTANTWVSAAKDAYKCVDKVYESVILCGISMGSLLAMQCALEKAPEGLVCIAPALDFADWRLRLAGPIAPFVTKLSARLGMKTVKSNETDINKGTIYPYFPIEATAPLYRISSNTKKTIKATILSDFDCAFG